MSSSVKENIEIYHKGRKIVGVLNSPVNKPKFPIVIFSHGFNGRQTDFDLHSEILAERGIGSFAFDFCGGSLKSKSDLRTTDMTLFTEKEDLSAVISTIIKRENIDKDNIFLFGASQGGLVTALAAEDYLDDVKGIILLYPAFCIPDNWNEKFKSVESIPDEVDLWGVPLGKRFFETIKDVNIYDYIGKYKKNVLIMHGDQDTIVPLDYGKRAAMIYTNAVFETFTGEGHGFSEEGIERVIEMTDDFISKNLSL